MISKMFSRRHGRTWTRGVPVQDRGPGESYRPENDPPSVFGVHQPGIATPVLDHLAFAAFDVIVERRAALHEVIGQLTEQAERLMRAGHRIGDRGPAGALTVTLGLGPGIFTDRLGLATRRPVGLRELPPFTGDVLDGSISGGDLCLQVCADTLPKAEDALARLVAVGRPAARLRWSQSASVHRRRGERRDARP